MKTEGYPKYLDRSKRIWRIVGEIEDSDVKDPNVLTFVEEKGYIYGEDIYIYKGLISSKNEVPEFNKENSFFIIDNGKTKKLKFIFSDVEEEKDAFKKVHLSNADLKTIAEEVDAAGELYDAETICNINASTSHFVPIINDDDDFLKKIIKYLIIVTNTDINEFKSVKDQKYWLTNLKQALIGSTKMSTINFRVWSELIGNDFDIIVYPDKKTGKRFSPLIYRSSTNEVYKINNIPGVEYDKKQTHLGSFMDKIYQNSEKIILSTGEDSSYVIKDDDPTDDIDY